MAAAPVVDDDPTSPENSTRQAESALFVIAFPLTSLMKSLRRARPLTRFPSSMFNRFTHLSLSFAKTSS